MSVILLCSTVVCGEDSRQPVPVADALKDAEKTVRDVFKADYAKTKPAERAEFAQKLLQQGMETKDDATTRYILFREAASQAAQAGDAATAMKALTELGKAYNVDALALKIDALAKAGGAAATADANKALAENYVALIDEAIAADNYDAAARATGPAESAARRAQDMPLVAKVQARAKELRDLQGEFVKVKAAKQTLTEKPDDPAANFAVGKFLCCVKGDWENGLPMLAKGNDASLKAAAERDLAKPVSPGDVAALGDAWWDAAEKATGATKARLQERAAGLYTRALRGLSGFAKTKLEKRIAAVSGVTKAETSTSLSKPVEIVANASDSIVKSGFTVTGGRFYRISVAGSWTDSDGRIAALLARIGAGEGEFDAGSAVWWPLPTKATTILRAHKDGELSFTMKDDKSNFKGRRGALQIAIAEIPEFKWPRSTTVEIVCLFRGGWLDINGQPHNDFIFTKEGVHIQHISGADVSGPIQVNGVIVWLTSGEAPLEFMEPLLKLKLALKKKSGNVTIEEAVIGEKLTVRVVTGGSFASFVIGP
ncbi:MAG: hypothetical protein NTW87_11620 [Planctomycetota bacterium]|nr:hypothetical protein [Planctomycetota bacterium]